MSEPLLTVEDLRVQFPTDQGVICAVDGVSFALHKGETLGIVGESGSGKTVTALSILGLAPQPPGTMISGRVQYGDSNLLQAKPAILNRIRGNRIAMVFQDPMTALNPFLTIEEQLSEVTMLHRNLSRPMATRHAIEMLQMVGIANASRRAFDYPHQFSGGMRQRVMIAMALSCQPDILIADEPTTAIDVTIQAQILSLMKHLQQEHGTAILLITHDLGVVSGICHRVNVMYAGRFVEEAVTAELFARPRHPYTQGLLNSTPRLDAPTPDKLRSIDGQPPDLAQLPSGCHFHPRCPFVMDQCRQQYPASTTTDSGGKYSCFADLVSLKTLDAP